MIQSMKTTVADFQGKKIVVWGDLILDEYIYTSAGRVSREAPVLVTEFEDNEYRLGGAGNVVMNILSLGGIPLPVGFIGRDDEGAVLKEILAAHNISTDGLVALNNYTTPIKSRILSGGENTRKQQILRIDTLHRGPLPERARRRLEGVVCALLEEADALLVSDYLAHSVSGAGFTRVRKKALDHLVTVDSRSHLPDFCGAHIATPNEPEIKSIFTESDFLHDADFLEAGEELRRRLSARGLVLKRGHKGMVVFSEDAPPHTIPIYGTTQIVDVTGAGDTVISVVTLALAAAAGLTTAAQLANIAAGMVVMHEGAYPITSQELLGALS